MSAHFGGSAAACDRRRRRLVQNTLQGSTLPVGGRSPRSGRSNSSENSEPAETASTPRRKWSLIPRNTRLLGVLCLLNVLAWAGVLWLGCSQWAIDRGLQQFTSLPDGPLIRSFSIFQLLMTSQLSFLIYWYRSRSRKDFMGRYRLWSWAGLFWSMVCLGMVSQAEFGFVRPLLRRFELDSWRPETMSWLLPLAIGVVAVYRVLRRELRQSRLSLTMWEISFSLSVLAAALNLGLDNFLPASIRATCTAAVWSLWHASLAISCLVHLRFVVHITNEAAPRQPSRGTRVLKWSHQHLTQVGERVVTSRPRLRRLRIDTPEATEHPAIKPPRTRLKKKLSEEVAEATQATSEPVRSAPKSAKAQSRTDEEPGSSPQSERTWSRWNPFRKTRAAASPESADQAAGAQAGETPLASVPAPHFSLSRLAKRRKSAEPGTESGSTSGKPDSKSDAAITSTASKGWWSRWKKPANADEAAAADAVKTKDQPAKEAKASPVAAAAKPPEKKADLSDEPRAERKGWWSRWKKSADADGAADVEAVKTKDLKAKEVKASPVAAPAKPPEKKADLSDEPQAERKGWWSRWKKPVNADEAAAADVVKTKEQPAKEAKASPVAVAAKPPEKKADLSDEPQAERKGWWSRWKKSADTEESASVKTAKSAVTAKAETPKHCEAPARPAPQQTTKPTPPVKKPEPAPVAEKVAEKTKSPAVTAESRKPAGKSWSLGWGSKKSVADSTPPAADKPTTDKPDAAKPAAEKPVTDKPVTKTEASKAPAAAPTMAARPSQAPAPAPAPAPKPAPAPVVSRKPIEDDEREEIPRSEKPRRKPEPMEMEPDDEDGEDYDYSEMSAKERKKLKKRLRQQGRGDRD